MRRLPSNIVSQRVFVQETATVYEESKWTIYAWWLVQSTVGGALGAITFSSQLASPWWLLPSYLVLVLALKRASVRLAQRLFAGDMWWQVTSIFMAAFLLAGLVAGVSQLTSWIVIALPLVLALSFLIGFLHTIFRVVYVREHVAWVWAAAPLATVAAVTGWVHLYAGVATLSTAASAAIAGAVTGFLYALLTTLLLALMWNVGVAQSKIGMAYVDKDNEFEEARNLHDAAIAANPREPTSYAARAHFFVRQHNLDQAKADIEHALALDPKSREARLVRAIIMSEEGDEETAIAEFDPVVDCKLGFQIGYVYRGRAYSRNGDYDRAFADFEKSISLGEDRTLTLVNRAETHYRMGDYDAAIADCELLFARPTTMPTAYFTAFVVRGKSYAAKGEHELAAADFRRTLHGTSDAILLREAAEGLHALPPTDEE